MLMPKVQSLLPILKGSTLPVAHSDRSQLHTARHLGLIKHSACADILLRLMLHAHQLRLLRGITSLPSAAAVITDAFLPFLSSKQARPDRAQTLRQRRTARRHVNGFRGTF